MFFRGDPFEPGDCLAWKQVDRILADAHFKLQRPDFGIFDDDDNVSVDSEQGDLVCMSIAAAFPLLLERGVSVEL
jgi:hypothetical protein